jgi:hypothetical protein
MAIASSARAKVAIFDMMLMEPSKLAAIDARIVWSISAAVEAVARKSSRWLSYSSEIDIGAGARVPELAVIHAFRKEI